ncbi:MAG: DUF2254 domain-containing protein [Motilibacteraceae bacterium]
MRRRWAALRESVRNGFWAVPTLCAVLSILLALGAVRLDRVAPDRLRLAFGAGPDGAREVLSDITTAMITFTGLVFSITVVVLQLTSSQFSPRALRTFLRDRQTQVALGVFIATFVYAILVLRTVDARRERAFVPAIATTLALLLLLASVAVFVAFIHHIATAIQVSSIIASIGAETRGTIERRFPSDSEGGPMGWMGQVVPPLRAGASRRVLAAPRPGVVTAVDDDRMVALARAAGVVVRTQVRLGDFVPEGAPLLELLPEAGTDRLDDGAGDDDLEQLDAQPFLDAVRQQRDRTMDQDVAFGLRQLVDVAERALSPAVNDPTTAVQALDQIHDLLRRLVTRSLRDGRRTDEDGVLRWVGPAETVAGFLSLGLDEIEHYGADSPPVRDRLDDLLADLLDAALPQHRSAVLEAQRHWEALRRRTSPVQAAARTVGPAVRTYDGAGGHGGADG